MPKPAVRRNDLTVPQIWDMVMRQYDELRKIASNMARIDRRLDPNELWNEALIDIVDARHQWNPELAFRPWVITRIWKTRTVSLRAMNRIDQFHATLGRRAHAVVGDDGQLMDPLDIVALDDGMWGSSSRSEAIAVLTQLIECADPDICIMIKCIMDGRKSRRFPKLTPDALARRVGIQLGLIEGAVSGAISGSGHHSGRDRGTGSVQCVLPFAGVV